MKRSLRVGRSIQKKVYCSKSNFLRKTHLFEKAAHVIKFTPEANPTKHFFIHLCNFNAFVNTFGHFLVDTLIFKHFKRSSLAASRTSETKSCWSCLIQLKLSKVEFKAFLFCERSSIDLRLHPCCINYLKDWQKKKLFLVQEMERKKNSEYNNGTAMVHYKGPLEYFVTLFITFYPTPTTRPLPLIFSTKTSNFTDLGSDLYSGSCVLYICFQTGIFTSKFTIN